ncbi:hypothetical protein V6N13_103790 [Hibiscus sabdariffa]|uniref:Uncharacterized protein n=2 Tax=Hibiscus sabdariffa TaxID=183260 RepID=A0ABR2NT43_9ROSI
MKLLLRWKRGSLRTRPAREKLLLGIRENSILFNNLLTQLQAENNTLKASPSRMLHPDRLVPTDAACHCIMSHSGSLKEISSKDEALVEMEERILEDKAAREKLLLGIRENFILFNNLLTQLQAENNTLKASLSDDEARQLLDDGKIKI